jgi:hypothetical protein
MNRRSFLREPIDIDYDPLAADPDYLLMGITSRFSRLYDQSIERGDFSLVYSVGDYDLYQRSRRGR